MHHHAAGAAPRLNQNPTIRNDGAGPRSLRRPAAARFRGRGPLRSRPCAGLGAEARPDLSAHSREGEPPSREETGAREGEVTCPGREAGRQCGRVLGASSEARAAGGRGGVQDVSRHGNSHPLPPRLSQEVLGARPTGRTCPGGCWCWPQSEVPPAACPTLLRVARPRHPPRLQGYCPPHGQLAQLKSV